MSTLGKWVLVGLLASVAARSRADEAHERQVTFPGAGESPLAGTLLVPSGEKEARFPALVLLPGSGPTDRNGNQPPALMTDLLKQIAEGLANRGVASLRFDKRGMYANAAAIPKDSAQYGDFFAWENFVADAKAAYQFLSKQPEIRADKVGFLGHSEGGVLSLAAAKELGAAGPGPAVIVLLSTPGRTLDALIAEQLTRLLKKQGATAEQSKYFLDENSRIVKAVQETGQVPAGVPAGLKALYPSYLGKFLKSCFDTDPCQLAGQYQGPVLVIAGDKDVQVSPERDAKALETALKNRTPKGRPDDDHPLVIVPEASHNLKLVKSDDDPGFTGEIAPGILDTIGAWLKAKFSSPKRAEE